MAKVIKGFVLGTRGGLTFYLLDGILRVRLKSSLSRKRVKFSPRFQRTMQSARELGRASKLAARVYRELSKEQKRMVYVLYKKMTGVAKMAFKWGKSVEEAERDVRMYLVEMGVLKAEMVNSEMGVVKKVREKEMVEEVKEEKEMMERKAGRKRGLPALLVQLVKYKKGERKTKSDCRRLCSVNCVIY